ncbi:MAG: hypothetical protein QOF48_385 [Verrucomicrobiota bacterium]|jgi:hypothetical protein
MITQRPLSNKNCKPLKMNATRFSCYSLAVKGFSAFSGVNHAHLTRRSCFGFMFISSGTLIFSGRSLSFWR